MKKRLLAFLAVALSVLFVLPLAGPIVTYAANALPRDEAQYVAAERNVALNKPVTVTEGRYIDNSDWNPSRLVDGIADGGLHLQAAPDVYDHEITEENAVDVTINLKGTYTIKSVRLKTPSPSYDWGALPYGWILQVSSDGGETFQNAVNVTSGNAFDSQVDVPAEFSAATHVRIHIYDDSNAAGRVGVNFTAIGELEVMGTAYDAWTNSPSYVDNNASALDTREGTLSYTPSADGKTVTISYYDPSAQETKSYVVPNNNNYLFGGFGGVDDLGRELSEAGENGVVALDGDQEKYIGIFYFLWHGMHDGANASIGKAWNLQAALEANGGYSYGTVGSEWDMHWFAEPLYGYYHGNDTYVYRKHVELLMNAGVDFLYFDITNNFSYTDRALTLMSILQEYSDQGYDVPQIVFYTNTDSLKRVREIYNDIYSQNLYPDTWFRIDGKPVVVAHPSTLDQRASETIVGAPTVGEFFTVKQTQWPNDAMNDDLPGNMTSTNNSWPWMDFHWPQRVYTTAEGTDGAISVSLAQHSGTTDFSDSATKGNRYQYNRGRSFQSNGTTTNNISYSILDTKYNSNAKTQWTNWSNDWSRSNYGYNFQEQFDYALKQTNVKYILITGWNEWVATNCGTADAPEFIDAASVEFSRDIEMTKGYYFDNYYMQLVSNIQKAKGTAPYIIQDQRYPINVTGSFDQWNKIALTYTDPMGDASYRNHIGYGPEAYQTYTNETGRNDIVASKITSDTKNVYFYIQTAEAISYYSNDAWMQIYVDVDRNASTGWYGYDYIINYAAQGEFTTTVAKYTGTNGAYKFEALADTVSYQVKNNQMMIAVPLAQLGISNYNAVNFEFKVLDAQNSDMTTMESFYTDGDVAPLGRLNYIYHGRTTDALDPVKNNAVADVIPEAEKPVEYKKTEGFLKLWGTESSTSSYRNSLTTNEATSVGVRLTVPADIVITDFSTMFTGVTDRSDITLRVYRWNNSQADTVKGVVVYEETKQYMATSGGDATVVVNLPAAGSNAITNGDYFFVWTSASGKTQAAQQNSSLGGVVSGLSTYANGSQISTSGMSNRSKHTRSAISYLKTTDTVATPVDTSKYTQVSNQKAHVILLAGQSNASGSTPNNDLALHESKNYARYQAGFSNVKILYWNDYGTTYLPDGNSSGDQFVNVTTAQGGNVNSFGIEIGLAEYLSETYPGETFYLIKSAIGGSMLTSQHADASASYWLNNGSTEGRAYTVFKNCVLNGLSSLEAQGLDPEVVAFMWMQGESDAIYADNAQNYLANMNSFNTQLQNMIPDQYEPANGIAILDSAIATNACWTYPSQVNAAKRQFAEQNQNYYYLDTTDLVATADAAHYGASDMIKLGRTFGAGVATVLKNAHYVSLPPSSEGFEAVRENVAFGKSCNGEVNQFAGNAGWTFASLTDGIHSELAPDNNVSGGVIFNNADVGADVNNQTLFIALGDVCLIDEIKLYAHTWAGFEGVSVFPSTFELDVYTKNWEWVTVVSDGNGAGRTWYDGALSCTFTPIEAVAVRIRITGASTYGVFNALGEMEVWGYNTAATNMVNAALNKGALVQPETNALQQGPTYASWDPARMTDGTILTSGQGLYLTNAPDGTYLSAPAGDTDLLIGLQNVYDLYYFELYPFQYAAGLPMGYGLPRAYTIYYSMDGVNWEEAISVDGNAEGANPYMIEWGKQTLYLESAVRAKFLKITVTDYCYFHHDGNDVPDWAGIGEFTAMGMPAYEAANTLPSDVDNVALGGTVNSYGTTLNWAGTEWDDKNMVDGIIPNVNIAQGLFFVGGTPGAEYGSAPDGSRTVDIKLNGTCEVYGFDLYATQFNKDKYLGYTYPTAYIIYTSADGGATWEPAYGFVDSTDQIWVPYHTAVFEESKIATDVRIVISHWSGNVECPVPQGIGEFVLYGKDLNAAANVAVGKPITKSGGGNTWGAIGDGWGVQFVNDGLTVSNTGVSSALMYDNDGLSGSTDTTGTAVGLKLTIDLQGTYEISEYALWQGMFGQKNLLPSGFTFSVSTNGGSSYTVVDTVTDYAPATQDVKLSRVLSQTYSGVTHVRLEVTANSGSGLTLIGELEVLGKMQKSNGVGTPDTTNKLTIAGISSNNSQESTPASKLTDGNTTTSSWKSAASATGANPTLITADLGSVYEVDSVLLYSASADASTLPRNFRIEVSYNGNDWTTVATYMGIAAVNAQGQAFTAKFARTYAQYVRVVITADSDADYSEIAELAICGSAHSLHVYTEYATADKNVKTAATCSTQAVYYVSCPCGANGTATFSAGGFAAHNYVKTDDADKLEDANCSTPAVYAKECQYCGKHGGGVFAKGEVVDHSFTAEEAHSNYLATEKTCADYATYYCSCATCNLKGTDTFEFVLGGKLPHTEDAGVYDKTTGIRTYHCDECHNVARTVGVEFSMSVTLGTNLDVNYFATVDTEATNPVLNIEVPGQEKLNATIAGVKYGTAEDGRDIYVFTYTDVGPQNVGTTVNLSLSCDENTVHQKAHAVESYLNDIKTDENESAAAVAAADALLVYANAAKRVVTADSSINVDVSNYVNVATTAKAVANNGIFATFKGATVWFDNVNRIRYTVELPEGTNVDDLTFKVAVNGGAETEITADNMKVFGNIVYIYTDGVEAAHYDDKYTVTVYNGDVAGASATYSVNSYVHTMQDKAESDQVLLAKALYMYGLSAKALAQ